MISSLLIYESFGVKMKRGIVALPHEIRQLDRGFSSHGSLTSIELNYFALYWDKISVPQNMFIRHDLPNEDTFISCGILDRPMVGLGGGFYSGDYPRLLAESQVHLVDKLREKDNLSTWSIHQKGDGAVLISDDEVVKETVRLELSNLLPVPSVGVHIHDILEFKERRRAELDALHTYCDELYFEVIKSADPRLQAAISFNKLKKAIEDLERLNAEGWRSPIRFDLNISPEFDLTQAYAGITAVLAALHSPQPVGSLLLSSAVLLIGGAVKVKPKLQSLRGGSNKSLVYVANAKKEGLF